MKSNLAIATLIRSRMTELGLCRRLISSPIPGLKLLLRASQRPEAAAPLELGLDDFETRFPGIAAWMQRVEQLPGYEKTYPPHWRHA